MVLADPPFGRKSSVAVVTEDGEEEREDLTIYRDDFWTTTSNKQLNWHCCVGRKWDTTPAPPRGARRAVPSDQAPTGR